MNNKNRFAMRDMSSLDVSNDARAPHADVTNAPTLFGDPFGDIEDGDYEDGDLYGDLYGDPDLNDHSLSVFNAMSGDPELGDHRALHLSKGMKRGLGIGAAALGTFAAERIAEKAIKRHIANKRAHKMALQAKISKQRAKQTIYNQRMTREYAGKISRDQKMPFFQLSGSKMNSSPIDPMEGFVADMFKHNLDRQASDTPFLQETAIGTYAAGVWTATALGVATNRFFTGLVLQVGINNLTGVPATVYQVTATIPTINGVLTVSTTPWIFTIDKGFDSKFLFFPWQLVSNRPMPVLGQYSAASPITVVVTGLPSAAAVNLIVPGSQHPWTIAMRNSLMK